MTVAGPLRITADELNCLIYSYFKDSGLVHSAFTILHEGNIQNSPYLARHIPRGELVDLLGKALLYLEVEAHWNPNAVTTNCKAGFSLLEPHVCSSEASTLKPPVPLASTSSTAPSTSTAQPTAPTQKEAPTAVPARAPATTSSRPPPSDNSMATSTPSTLSVNEVGIKRKTSPVASDIPVEKRQRKESPAAPLAAASYDARPSQYVSRPKPSGSRSQGPGDDRADPRAVRLLRGHDTEIFVCAWNPEYPEILTTGSRDSEVIFWDLSKKALSPNEFVTDGNIAATLGKVSTATQGDLTSLHWSADGSMVAIGSYDAILRVATSKGKLWMEINQHDGPIFATRFSRKGSMLLTASLDGTSAVWDVSRRSLHRQYRSHTDCCLDADWVNEKVFASTGADHRVVLMHIDYDEPIKVLEGHEEEVNQIRTNSAGTRLASCSDDGTARIWRTDNLRSNNIPGFTSSSSSDIVFILRGHDEPVSAIAWCPTANLYRGHEMLATASFDKTARVWDTVTGECLAIFTDHTRPVYALVFCPDGRFVATGGGDGWLFVYSMTTFKLVYSWYAGADKPGIFEIDWQWKNGYNRIACALECKEVMVLDCTKIPELHDSSRTSNGTGIEF